MLVDYKLKTLHMKQTYNERVQEIAEKMVKEHNDKLGPKIKNLRLSHVHFLPAARIAVEEMAQTVRRILFPNHSAEYINNMLRSEGLIPNEKEVNNDL